MKLLSVNVGRARPVVVDGREASSAFLKRPVAGRVPVHLLGLEGDEPVEPSRHGGYSTALFAYPSEHSPFWRTVRAQARVAGWDELLPPGSLGENLSLEGLLESQVFVGDVLRFPDCALAVSAPRLPGWEFNAAMGFGQALKLLTQSTWCGFYLAVRQPGSIAAGDAFELVPGPREVNIVELFRARTGG
jgi:MOSC domain-containing protein YiiM